MPIPNEKIETKATTLTVAQIRSEMIARKVKAGLKPEQAADVVDRQLKRDAALAEKPKKKAPVADPRIAAGLDAHEAVLDDHEERLEALEKAPKLIADLEARIKALEKTAKP